jgi:hypothetical protein
MWEAAAAASAVGIPLAGWVLSLQGRLTALETWRQVYAENFSKFEERILRTLERIETKLDQKADRP